jgi:FMN-dependent NADH-azoreductase
MAKLLYIEASPRKKRSSSIAVAKTFLETYRKTFPEDQIQTIDLWQKEMPEFSGDVIEAKYAIMHQQPHTAEQIKAWEDVEKIIAEFKAADKYLFSLPMWNFGIPYKLKQYIDLLVQPGYTFQVTPQGEYEGLVKDKKVALIYARGGEYGIDAAVDFQKKYMEAILGFIGFKDFVSVIIQPTLCGPEQKKKILDAAQAEAQKKASQFSQSSASV